MNVPRVVIGVPLYNHADDLPKALESLLNQSYREFRLVCVDDQSSDGTADIVRRYAAQDDRIVYTRNPARLGMIDNWRRVFDLALADAPEAEYFAGPFKANPPLVVDADAVLALAVTFERFESVTRQRG